MDFRINNGELYLYMGDDRDVVIPEGVTSIAALSFRENDHLRSVIVPAGVTQIGAVSFQGCDALESVILPDGLERIGSRAFQGCKRLANIKIPDSVTEIGEGAFQGCSCLADENGFVRIDGVLYDCICSDSEITIPAGVTAIGEGAFAKKRELTVVRFPSGVRKIGERAFFECSSLREVFLPDGLEIIGGFSFYGCKNLEYMPLPDSLMIIEPYAFTQCRALGTENGGIIFHDTLYEWTQKNAVVRIPRGVTAIAPYVFEYDDTVTTLIVPDTVTTIGVDAFRYCKSLRYLEIPESVTNLEEIWHRPGNLMLKESPLEVLRAPGRSLNLLEPFKTAAAVGYSEMVLQGRSFSRELDGEYLKYIKGQRKRLYPVAVKHPALMYYMMDRKVIPLADLQQIIDLAEQEAQIEVKAALMEYSNRNFSSEEKVKNIEAQMRGPTETAVLKKLFSTKKLPNGTLMITSYKGEDAEVFFPGQIGKATVTAISGTVFERCSHSGKITLISIPDTVTEIEGWAFNNCRGANTLILSSKASVIRRGTFNGCTGLRGVLNIPEGVTTIEYAAFRWCSNLTELVIPNSVTTLETEAFFGCEGLKKVTLPRHLKNRTNKAFNTNPQFIWT